MSPVKERLDEVIDGLTERDQLLLLEIAERFLPDDVATPDDLEAIAEGTKEYLAGETIGDQDIDWS